MRPKEEPGASDRDISDLLDRVSYKLEAKVLEPHPTPHPVWVYGHGQAGHSSNLCYTGAGRRKLSVIGAMTSEELPPCQGDWGKGCCFPIDDRIYWSLSGPGLEKLLAGGWANHTGSY